MLGRMLARAVPLAALLVLAVASSAPAASFSDVVPVYDAADGVTAPRHDGRILLRFTPKAGRIYRTFAGRRATILISVMPRSGISRSTSIAVQAGKGGRTWRRWTAVIASNWVVMSVW